MFVVKGDVLNIDPMKFYTHLYKTLFKLHAGMFLEDACLVRMYSLRICYDHNCSQLEIGSGA